MKKLLLIEIIAAVLFLSFLTAAVGILTHSIHSMNTSNGHVQTRAVKGDTLKIQMGNLEGDFSPLQYQGETEENFLSLCFDNLLFRDEKGRAAEVESGWKKGEEAFAHISTRKAQDGSSYISICINPEKKTPDGRKLTGRDVIFNYYLRLDASSGLPDCFSGAEIAGAREYTYGSHDLAARQKEIDALVLSPTPQLKKGIQEDIILPELRREYLWVQGLYGDEKYQFITSKYTQPKDLFAYYYAYQTSYQSASRTESQVMEDIAAQYGANYIALGKVTERDYSEQVKRMALREILKQPGKDSVFSVPGIRLVDEHTVEIHVLSGEQIAEKVCDFWVLPLPVYGKEASYNGQTSFGFRKGEAKQIISLAQEKLLGSGAYYMENKKKDTIYLKKNAHYQNKVETGNIEIIRKSYEKPEDVVNAILKGRLDLAVTGEDASLERLLKSRGTGAAHQIKKIKMQSDNLEECVLYRTDYVNATTLPRQKQTIRGIFSELYRIKINTTSIQ